MTPYKEPTNKDRADHAGDHVAVYTRGRGLDPEVDLQSSIGDFLADLMHFCAEEKIDFDRALRQARRHFHEERKTDA